MCQLNKNMSRMTFMARRAVVCGMVYALALLLAVPALGQDGLHVHMISGSNEYKSEASLKKYKTYLEDEHDLRVTASWVADGATELPGVSHVPQADVLLVFARRMKLPDDAMDTLREYWNGGGGIVGVRTASHAFRRETNQVFDHEVLGGNYQGHFSDAPVEVENSIADHPVLKGVGPFSSRKMYKAGDLADGATVLQTGRTTIDGTTHSHPVTWTHRYRDSRTVYTSLGVPADFENKNFRRLLTNAIFWVARDGSH